MVRDRRQCWSRKARTAATVAVGISSRICDDQLMYIRCSGAHNNRRGRSKGFLAAPGQAQEFLSAHAFIHGHFHPRRHLMAATAYRSLRSEALNVWQQEACVRYTA
jgi:hypothetical protein